MGYKQVNPKAKAKYMRLRHQLGYDRTAACREAKISYSTGRRFDEDHHANTHRDREFDHAATLLTGPIPYDQLSDRAKRGYDDFEFFRRTYLGHISTRWQIDTANLIVEALATPHKEYIVENVAPGGGKSTLAVDIACWVIVRNRRIRILFGSRVQSNADRQLKRVRRTLERTSPFRASDDKKALGLECDAEATLAHDYGLFRPVGADTWRGDEFIVAQFDDELIEEKEPTCSSYGMDSGVLGNRFNLMMWDDVVDKTTIRTLEATESQRQWWDDEAETRLEPAGVLWLIGQRMAANDLYRYNIDKRMPLSEEDAERAAELPEADRQALEQAQGSKYRHVLYKAHYEELCNPKVTHKPDAPAWPEGCLLDPYRIPWRELYTTMHTNASTFAVQFQQEDSSGESQLVKKVWVSGGTCPDEGTMHPGCVDDLRGLCELPDGLVGPKFSFCTVDPSPTKMWAIHWYIATPEADNRLWLMDLLRVRMGANELLDYDVNQKLHTGVMEDWQARSHQLGWPITDWIVENNAAQKFMLQYQFASTWQQKWGVNLRPFTTTIQKLDPKLGIDVIRDWWKYGRVRLPYRPGEARLQSMKLIDEVVKYPKGWYDDQVMAHWFAITHLPKISYVPSGDTDLHRPSYLQHMPDPRRLMAV